MFFLKEAEDEMPLPFHIFSERRELKPPGDPFVVVNYEWLPASFISFALGGQKFDGSSPADCAMKYLYDIDVETGTLDWINGSVDDIVHRLKRKLAIEKVPMLGLVTPKNSRNMYHFLGE